jgi:quercetin dioxygenase-like cupin family protein
MKSAILYVTVMLLGWGVAPAQTNDDANPLAKARVFPYESMAVTTTPNGVERANVFSGTLATGEVVGAHETMQPAGETPSAAHKIQHSELIVVQQGTLELQHDGKAERVGPGGILYVAFGTTHAVKNVGSGPAKYVVIQIGGDTKVK